MAEFKWKINSIRMVFFFKSAIDFDQYKHNWSSIITGKKVSSEISQDELETEKIYMEIVDLDENKKFHLIFANQNVIDIRYSFDHDKNLYSLPEISNNVNNFIENLEKIYEELNFEENIARVGHIVELSVPILEDTTASEILKNNVLSFVNIDDDLEEIHFRTNKTGNYKNIPINKVITYFNAQKLSVDANILINYPKAHLQDYLVLNIDINTDVKYQGKLSSDIITSLKDESIKILNQGGIYAK